MRMPLQKRCRTRVMELCGVIVLTATAAQLGWSVTRGFNEVLKQRDWTLDKLTTISEQIDKDDPFCLVLDCTWTDPGIPQRAEVLKQLMTKRTPYVAYPSAMAQEAAQEGRWMNPTRETSRCLDRA